MKQKWFDTKVGKCKKRLRDLLEVGGKVLVLAERLRNRDARGRLNKSTTENKNFLTETELSQ